MKKIAWITAICLLIVMSAMALVACGGDKDKGQQEQSLTLQAAKANLENRGYFAEELSGVGEEFKGAVAGLLVGREDDRSGPCGAAYLFESKSAAQAFLAEVSSDGEEQGMSAEIYGLWVIRGTKAFCEDFKK